MAPKTAVGLEMLGIYNRVQHLKHDLAVTRVEHEARMSEIELQFQMSKERLLAAVKGTSLLLLLLLSNNR